MEEDRSQREFLMGQFPSWSGSDSLPHPTQMQEQGCETLHCDFASKEGKPGPR